jgi:Eukaryotic aspartyl protease
VSKGKTSVAAKLLTQSGLNEVYGSLVLGGYDTAKFKPNNLTFNFGPQDDRELLVELNKITTDDGTALLQQPISISLDSTVPYIYLPQAACAMFESTFGLVWDRNTQLYLLTDAQHTSLKAQNPKITFTLGTLTSLQTVEIILPYSAFDLTVSYPIVANTTRYFPLKRANDSSQYTLGRTFFQEAYVSFSQKKKKKLD